MCYFLRVFPLFLLLNSSFVLATAVNDVNYIGSKTCATCHQQEFTDWQGSHHDQAMMHANKETVLGDFNNSRMNVNDQNVDILAESPGAMFHIADRRVPADTRRRAMWVD